MLKFKKTDLLPLLAAIPANSELLLVHDQGVYIMSMAQPVGKRTIVYAEGCNPGTDAAWWETSRRLVGGDDFGEPFATARDIRKHVETAKHGLTITVTETQFVTETY